jgi:hypothetical protein
MVAFNIVPGRAHLTGRIVDPETGDPVAHATVTIEGTNISAQTDSNGVYILRDVPAGTQRLIVNAPDHEVIRQDIEVATGVTTDLGATSTRSIVFNPNSPPSATAYSVIGRRATETVGRMTFDQAKQVIEDAMLMVGGDEAGVLDEYGNQLNPELSGAGLVSLKPKGRDMIADRMLRNETVSLQEVLYVLSFAFEWSDGYPNIEEWLTILQGQVNQAWRDPTNPENAMMVLLFNKGRYIAYQPPRLSPFTRLNALQAHLLVSSILAAGVVEMLPKDTGLPQGKSIGKNYFTRYWRNFFTTKASHIQSTLTAGAIAEMNMMSLWMLMSTSGGAIGATLGATLAGMAPDYLGDAMVNAGVALNLPEPPQMFRADVLTQADGTKLVDVLFRPSPSAYSDDTTRFIYNLYRFHGDTEDRDFIDESAFPADQPEYLKITDPSPLIGLHFYAVNVTRYWGLREDPTESWWPAAFASGLHIFAKAGYRVTSDYSAPINVYTGPGDLSVSLDGLEPDPDPLKDVVYYSDASKGILYKIENSGSGPRSIFGYGGFKPSFREGRQIVQYGLAIDSDGNLYSNNNASNETFGGRLFCFLQPDGSREFCGTTKYFSQLLMFAHPCDAGPMVMSPKRPGVEEELFLVENLGQEVLTVQVRATYDPARRVGQFYAKIPPGGWGRAIDAEFCHNNIYHLLDGWRVIKFKDGLWILDAYFTQD